MSDLLSKLAPAPGARKTKKRVGRGPGSGLGKTSGRGQKGQRSRSGGSVSRGFEGGQMPAQRRMPKRGFSNPFRKEFAIVNVGRLEQFDDGAIIDPKFLLEQGIVKQLLDGVKILGQGELSKKLTIRAHAVSRSAKEKIERAGGIFEEI